MRHEVYSDRCQWYGCATLADYVVELRSTAKPTLGIEVCDMHITDAILYLDTFKKAATRENGFVVASPLLPF
jgi:hypothetical protein